MTCTNCVEVKDRPLAYKRCVVCGNWCPLEPQEQAKVDKRKGK